MGVMGNPWTFAGVIVALFLAVQIVSHLLSWVRAYQRWEVAAAWNHDDSHSGATTVRVRFPAPGYRVRQRGSRFRAERVDFYGEVVDRFRVRRHMNEALQDCWTDFEVREAQNATSSGGMGMRGSELPGASGNLHTA